MADSQLFRRLPHNIPGPYFLWFAILVFGASGAITRRINQLGAEHLIHGQNPISLCNVLFVGNLCALISLLIIYRSLLNRTTLRRLSRQDWFFLICIAVLAGALAPGVIFQALALTSVNNVILVGRLEPSLTLALSIFLLGERVNLLQVVGAIAALLGVGVIIFFPSLTSGATSWQGFQIGAGELFAVVGAVALSISTIISKKNLTHVPLGLYSIVRNIVGTIIFFCMAMVIYGKDHFMNAFSPFLWQWMLLYGSLIVVAGQSFWLVGLRNSSVAAASLAGSFTPVAGILFSYLILDEAPTLAHYLGGSIILAGILISHFGTRRKMAQKESTMAADTIQQERAIATNVGYKGV